MNYVEFGSAHNDTILRSAEAVCRMRPSCILHRMKGLRHGEFSICHADRYADNIRRIISGESTF